jgi:RNA polymerase sigma-70 factor, ECF subfamily
METLAAEIASHVSRMYRVALRIVGSVDAAQEVAQDACVKALRGAETFDGRSALATWLHRITVNCAHDHLRKSGRVDRGRSDWDSDTMGMLTVLDAGPAEHAEQSELYHLALKLVAALPDDCRSAFVLTQLDGYTYDEAATIEDLPRGTIASRVCRARKLLMEQTNHH